LEAELEGTLEDTEVERQMKKEFVEDIARPVWQRGDLIERLRKLAEEAEEILDEEDVSDEVHPDDEDEDMHEDDDELDEIEDAIYEEEYRRRRSKFEQTFLIPLTLI
jgi:hypothetical protein